MRNAGDSHQGADSEHLIALVRKAFATKNKRGAGKGVMQGLQLHVMDVRSLNLGPTAER